MRTAFVLLLAGFVVACSAGAESTPDTAALPAPLPPSVAKTEPVSATPAELPVVVEAPDWRETRDALPEDVLAQVWGTGEDPRPPHFDGITEDREGQHYLVSDEENPQMFAGPLEDLGGALLGVGTDQMYFYIGWMRPTLAFLTDYDPYIKGVHLAHMAIFLHCADYACFREMWTARDREPGQALIEETWTGHEGVSDEDVEQAVRLYGRMRDRMRDRLPMLEENMLEMGIPGLAHDPEQYTYVRDLIAAGRVRPLTANLLLDGAFNEVSALCTELGVPVRALYVSNAETYWSFDDTYRDLIDRMPFDETSLILRTFPSGSRNGDYTYAVQSAALFREWLADPDVERVWQMATYDRDIANHAIPLVVLDELPE